MIDSVAQTVVELFDRRIAQSADAVAIHAPSPRGYVARKWQEIGDDVDRLAAALRQAGVARGDPVIQIAENSYRWIIADLAVHVLGAVHVAVHASLSGPQMAFQIIDTDSRIVILGDERIAGLLATADVDWPRKIRFFSYGPTPMTIGGHAVPRSRNCWIMHRLVGPRRSQPGFDRSPMIWRRSCTRRAPPANPRA